MTIQFLTYFDRGIMSSVIIYAKWDPEMNGYSYNTTSTSPFVPPSPPNPLVKPPPPPANETKPFRSDKETGALASGFIGGFMAFCPVFALLSKYFLPSNLMAIGLLAWCGAVFFSGISSNYYQLLIARVLVGVGEASFVGLAPTVLDNIVQPAKKGLWISLFYCTIPLGVACGIGVAGVVADDIQYIKGYPGWKVPWLILSVVTVPLSLLCAAIPKHFNQSQNHKLPTSDADTDKEYFTDEQAPNHEVPHIHTALITVLKSPTWLLASMGYVMYTFVIGAIQVWIPTYTQVYVAPAAGLSISVGTAIVGGITALTGLGGGILGGVVVDKFMPGGSSGLRGVANNALLNAASIALCIPCGLCALLFPSPAWLFFGLLFLATLFLFLNQGPINVVLLGSVPPNCRSYSMAFNVLLIHLLGDFPSPYIVGWLADSVTLRWALVYVWFLIILCALLWASNYVVAKKKARADAGFRVVLM